MSDHESKKACSCSCKGGSGKCGGAKKGQDITGLPRRDETTQQSTSPVTAIENDLQQNSETEVAKTGAA